MGSVQWSQKYTNIHPKVLFYKYRTVLFNSSLLLSISLAEVLTSDFDLNVRQWFADENPSIIILPDRQVNERTVFISRQESSITHGICCVISCFYYLEFVLQLLNGKDKFEIYKNLQTVISGYLVSIAISLAEIGLFDRLLKQNIFELKQENIFSSGLVLPTLEAGIWCFLTTESYKEAVLKAINLGDDTDIAGAVTGGLAGLYYGFDNIPQKWIKQMAR